jgi:CheY-like chemotaxis protein
MNLALNARDAMSGHGSLTIATSSVAETPPSIAADAVTGNGYVLLEISDEGAGMDEDTRSRMFEPFFTTKPEGMGTGLGLATVYNIVTKASGHILVESEPGRGAKFSIYLPAAAGPAASPVVSTSEREMRGDGKTVLLVEDEVAVRQVVKRMLENQGYRVIAAEDGASALLLAKSFHELIDLVVSDTVMPGMGGAEAVRELKKLRPGLKALFMSGHTDDQVLRSGISAATVKFIQKPFAAADFAAAVSDALMQ